MMITFDLEFFQTVYLKTDKEQHGRQITEIHILPGNLVKYCISLGDSQSWHYREEITTTKNDVLLITS